MRKILLVVTLLGIVFVGKGQLNRKSLEEFGLGLAIISAYTDVGGTSGSGEGLVDFSISAQRPGVFCYYKKNFGRNFSGKANLLVGVLARKDDGSRNDNRRFGFTTPFAEIAGIGVYHIITEEEPFFYPSKIRGGRSWSRNVYPSLYVQVGLGALFYSPIPNESMKAAKNAGYEGGKVVTPTIPVGLGSTLPVARDVRFLLEANYVFTLTDYLEGYSNSKYSKNKDMYFSFNIGLSYQIGSKNVGWGRSKNRRR